jgi:hypothetical protein
MWFSAESHFLLQKRDGRIRVYRHRNEHLSSSRVQEVDSYGGGSVMMWAGISDDRKTELVQRILSCLWNGVNTAPKYGLLGHLKVSHTMF